MEKKPFIGKFSGFLFIGEEKAEYDGEMLTSYYAKPYCTGNADVLNCIEFQNDCLTIRDVRSPDGKEYDCIWEQEDIESVLDKLGMVTAYRIDTIACSTIKHLVIPSDCMGIANDAFAESPTMKSLICLGDPSEMANLRDISLMSALDYFDGGGADDDAAEIQYHLGVSFLLDPESGTDCGRYISGDCSEVGSKWIFFWGKHTIIPENVIDKDAVIVGFTGSTAGACTFSE